MITILRNELKYTLSYQEFALLRPRLQAVLYPDTHGGAFGYTVRSLYFDSVYDTEYYAAADGLLCKSKIRLRSYGEDSTIKLEQKQKQGIDSRKRSLILTREEALQMQCLDFEFLTRRPEPEARGIYLQLVEGAYQPKSLVEYDREAYVFPAGDVRITYDTGTRATIGGWNLFDKNPPFAPVIPGGTGVMEVKYTGLLPPFIKGLIETGNLTAANSKYVQSRDFFSIGG